MMMTGSPVCAESMNGICEQAVEIRRQHGSMATASSNANGAVKDRLTVLVKRITPFQ